MFNEFYGLFYVRPSSFFIASEVVLSDLGANFIKSLSNFISKFKMIPEELFELTFVCTSISFQKMSKKEITRIFNEYSSILTFMFQEKYMEKLPNDYSKLISFFTNEQRIGDTKDSFKKEFDDFLSGKLRDLFENHKKGFFKYSYICSIYNAQNADKAFKEYATLINIKHLNCLGVLFVDFKNSELSGYMINYLFDRFCKNKSGLIPSQQNEKKIGNIQELRRDGIINELSAMVTDTEEYMDILKIALLAIADNDELLFLNSLSRLKYLFVDKKLQFNYTQEKYSEMFQYIIGNITPDSQEFVQISKFVLTTGLHPMIKESAMLILNCLNFKLSPVLVEVLFDGLFNNNETLKFNLFDNESLLFLEQFIKMEEVNRDMILCICDFINTNLQYKLEQLKLSKNYIEEQIQKYRPILSEQENVTKIEMEEVVKKQEIILIKNEIENLQKKIKNIEFEIHPISKAISILSGNTVEETQIDTDLDLNDGLNEFIKIAFLCKNKMNKFQEVNQCDFIQQPQVFEQKPCQLHEEEANEFCAKSRDFDEELADDDFQEVNQCAFVQQIHVSNKIPYRFQQIHQQKVKILKFDEQCECQQIPSIKEEQQFVEFQQMPEQIVKQYGHCNCQQNFVIKQQGKKERSSEESYQNFM